MPRVVIVDYKMGNVASVKKAFESLGADVIISLQKPEIETAEFLVLPGVGAFGDGMRNLAALGLVGMLNQKVITDKTPILGICLGMQLLAEKGFEFGEHEGLGFIKGQVIKLNEQVGVRLPHVGWNEITATGEDPLILGLPDNNFYFDHSFHFQPTDESVVIATCTYGQPFAAALHVDNIFATQFHPEKSQLSGLALLKNFLNYRHA